MPLMPNTTIPQSRHLALLLTAGLAFLSGCVVEERRPHREVIVEPAPVAPAVGVHVNFIAQPPPPPRHEVIVERTRPSRDHVWIQGYWVWREGRHVWIGGHWERPPRPHAVWVEPRWEHRHEGYVFVDGYWR